MSDFLGVMAMNPPGFPSADIPIAAARAGFAGCLCLEHLDSLRTSEALKHFYRFAGDLSLAIDTISQLTPKVWQTLTSNGLRRIILCDGGSDDLPRDVEQLFNSGVSVLVQVRSLAQARRAEELGVDGLIVKGAESGGAVGEETSFILLQRVAKIANVPVWVRGGVGIFTSAACLAAGAVGVVLDWALCLAAESRLPAAIKRLIAGMDGGETAVIGDEFGVPWRVFARPSHAPFVSLELVRLRLMQSDHESDSEPESLRREWVTLACKLVNAPAVESRLLLVGQDAAFASELADEFLTVGRICGAVATSAKRQCRVAARDGALRDGGPLAQSHQTRFPIVQGPMTRVSDNAAFAGAVANGGALPFLALALMRGEQVSQLLSQTKKKLGTKPWGVGILGFVPQELREEQLQHVRRIKPAFAIIAGGRPDQAAALERDGIRTYLHVPSPQLLSMYIETGSRHVIFEGRECGGHVGPRSSFVLWEQMIGVLVEHIRRTGVAGEEFHVLFAGGIHNGLSAAMVAAIASPLTERGVRIGVLMGTAYLFTNEIVGTGAIVAGFQNKALSCSSTVLLESGVGHATRCADSPYAVHFYDHKRRLAREDKPTGEIRLALETMNLGRLRVASKGVVRATETNVDARLVHVNEESQRRDGLYMIGQVAALRGTVCSIESLHREVCDGSIERLQSFTEPMRVRSGTRRDGDVAIVGLGGMFPKAGNLQQFWTNLVNKVDAIGEIPSDRWDWKQYFDDDRTAPDRIYSKWGGFIDPIVFDPTKYGMVPNSVPSIEPLHLLVIEAVRSALEDAGYIDRRFDKERTSVILGAGGGVADLGLSYGFRALLPYFLRAAGRDPSEAERIVQDLDSALPQWTEDSFAGLLMNVAAGRVANRFDFGGANYTVDAACASSLAAVQLAVSELESRSSDTVIVGGADTMQSPFAYLCFSKTQALSPTGRCRTFDASADGIVISEGIAIAVLKRLADAERDGDRVYAVIKGVGASSDGKAKGLTAPRPAGQVRALERAYSKAGVSPATVGLFEAHGTGTVAGDQSEIESLSEVLNAAGAAPKSCAVGSVKSFIGHTKCAAGVAGLVKAALSLHHKTLTPTGGVETPNPAADCASSALYVNSETRPWLLGDASTPRRAGVSAFGFGGTNFHAVLEEHQGDELTAPSNGPSLSSWPVELFVWRGCDVNEIGVAIRSLEVALDAESEPNLTDLAVSLARSFARTEGDCRLAIVASSLKDLRDKLARANRFLTGESDKVSDPRGIFFARDASVNVGKIAFLFPGQGSQHVNMLRDLTLTFPGVREVVERAGHYLSGVLERPLTEYIFPPPTFTEVDTLANEIALTQTEIAQPAMGAADIAMLHVLATLGVEPDMLAGHSYGEYVALHAAGILSERDLLRISSARGRLIRAAAIAAPGTMAAAEADEDRVVHVLSGVDGVVVANLNSPNQTVLSGTVEAIELAMKCLSEAGVKARTVNVSCAFHSPLVQGACQPFADELGKIDFAPPRVPVYSNLTSGVHENKAEAIKANLVKHLTHPVRFVDELKTMHRDGARVFIEVGPGATLTTLVEQTLTGLAFAAIPLDRPARSGIVQLCHAVGQLLCAGVDLHILGLFAGRTRGVVDVDRLLAESMPSAPPATAWLVSGAKSVPLSGTKTPRALTVAPTHESVEGSGNIVRPVSPTLSEDGNVQVVSPSIDPPRSPLGKGGRAAGDALEKNAGDVLGKDAGDATPQSASVHPVESGQSPTQAAGHCDEVDDVMASYQRMMSTFIQTQRDVMLRYLSRQKTTTSEGMNSPSAAEIELNADNEPALARAANQIPSTSAAHQTPTQQAAPQPDNKAIQQDSSRADVLAKLVMVVSERTGYPPDMLDPSLDLEADLGIDSIKRVEILGSLQQSSLLPTDGDDGRLEEVAKLKTLNALADWLVEAQSATASPTTSTSVPTVEPKGNGRRADVQRSVLTTTKYLAQTNESYQLADRLIVVTDDGGGCAQALLGKLHAQGATCEILSLGSNTPEAIRAALDEVKQNHDRPIFGLIVLEALRSSVEDDSNFLENQRVSCSWSVEMLYELSRALADDLRGTRGFVAVASKMGGSFSSADGVPVDDFDLAGGAVAGFIKALSHEWPEVRCMAVDFERHATPDSIADSLLEKICAKDHIIEIGRAGDEWHTLTPVPATLEGRAPVIELTCESVVLITGGARGITGEVALEIAKTYKPRLVIVGRTPAPTKAESSDTCGLTDIRSIKDALRARIEAAGAQVTPSVIEATYRELCGQREVRANLQALKDAGAIVEYRSLDVRDTKTFTACIEDVYARYDRIDGVIHGAGVTEDKFLTDKTIDSLRRVFGTKVDAAFTLASTLRGDSLKFLFFFSSVAARYGNRGQCDYAAANEVLNKLAILLDARWSARVASLNWGPWESTGGMVSAELARRFAQAGVKLISRADGRRALLNELRFGRKGEVEVILGGPVHPVITAPPRVEKTALKKNNDPRGLGRGLPLLSANTLISNGRDDVLQVVRTLDPATDLYLIDHQLDGCPVMPMAMVLELLAETAVATGKDLALADIRDLRVLNGIVLQNEALPICVIARPHRRSDGACEIELELLAPRNADAKFQPGDDHRGRVCYRAWATLLPSPSQSTPQSGFRFTGVRAFPLSVGEAYERWLFHGPIFAGIDSIESLADNGIVATLAPSSPSRCLVEPVSGDWLIDPVIVDSGLQMLMLWARAHHDLTPLPTRLGCFHRIAPALGPVRCEVRIRRFAELLGHADILFHNDTGEMIGWIEDLEFVCSKSLNRLARAPRSEGGDD